MDSMQQPASPTNDLTEPSFDEYARMCGRTIVFVFAPNEAARGGIEPAVASARAMQAPAIFVLADLSCADQAVEAVRRLQRKGRTMIQATEMDFATIYGDAIDSAGAHLEELPRNLLEVMRALSESVLDVYESVLVVDASQPIPAAQELYALCERLRGKDAPAEAYIHDVAEPSPYAISRSYLDRMDVDE